MTQTPPTSLQLDDPTQDALDRLSEAIVEIKDTLNRIARAVEALSTTGAD